MSGLKQGEVRYCTLAVANTQTAIILDTHTIPGAMMETWAEDNTWVGQLPTRTGLYRMRVQFCHTHGEDGEPQWTVLGYEVLWVPADQSSALPEGEEQ